MLYISALHIRGRAFFIHLTMTDIKSKLQFPADWHGTLITYAKAGDIAPLIQEDSKGSPFSCLSGPGASISSRIACSSAKIFNFPSP